MEASIRDRRTRTRHTSAMIAATFALACASCAPLPKPVPLNEPCTVTDGDTIRCGDERIRLLAIDAPEMGGRCRKGRQCVAGDPLASKANLERAIENGPLWIIRIGEDRYGRTLADVRAGAISLSRHQIATGHAVYVAQWDNRSAISRTCPAAKGQ